MLDPAASTSTSSSNTGVVIGAVVAAVVVIVTVILTSVCILYRRKPSNENTQDVVNIKNAAYEGDIEPDEKRLPQLPHSDRSYEEPSEYTQLDSSKRVPTDANYQSLNTECYQQLDTDHNENVHQYTSLNIDRDQRNEAPEESIYEELP